MLTIACRCVYCSTLLEHPLGEFYEDLKGAIEEAEKRHSERIPLVCPECTKEYLDKDRRP